MSECKREWDVQEQVGRGLGEVYKGVRDGKVRGEGEWEGAVEQVPTTLNR